MSSQLQSAVSLETHHEIEQFLYYEARLLDAFEMEEWLSLLDEDIVLKVPIRSDFGPASDRPAFSEETYYIRNDHAMLTERVDKLSKEYAWSENPRSRVRHLIGNVTAERVEDGVFDVWNTQFVYRSQGDTTDYDLLVSQRETRLERDGDGFRILNRTVYLDHSILATKNITLPLL